MPTKTRSDGGRSFSVSSAPLNLGNTMKWFLKMQPRVGALLPAIIIASGPWSTIEAQNPAQVGVGTSSITTIEASANSNTNRLNSTLERYFDPLQGSSASDLVQKALALNGE